MKRNFYKIFIFWVIFLNISTFSLCDDVDNDYFDIENEFQSVSNSLDSETKKLEINARAYVVIDRNSNTIICGKNENEKRKMASTTKIMTALVIIENYELNTTVEISKKAASTGGSRLGLKAGDKITVRDLLYGLMLRSGNDAAVALAEYSSGNVENFAELMNSKASKLGLTNTHFETPHGLDSEMHYTTAYELAQLSNYALNNKTFASIVGTKTYTITINGTPKSLTNTNELLGNFYGVYGVKTGFTNGANRCLVTACKRDNMDIICVVLGSDTKKLRTTDSIKLINYTFENFKMIDLNNFVQSEFNTWCNSNLKNFTVDKGVSQDVSLYLQNLPYSSIPIKKDLSNTLKANIECKTNLVAPVLKDSEIGTMKIFIDNNELYNYKIFVKNNINKKSAFSYFKYLLKNQYTILNENI